MAMLKFTALTALVTGTLAMDNLPTFYSSITAGQGFSCGVLETTGRVECWGNGAFGEMPSLAVLESRLMDVNHLSISAGGLHVCGLYYEGEERRENVKAYCVASFETGADQDMGQLDIPDLGEGMFWRKMSAGGLHSCGIDNKRKVHCWGSEADNRRNLGVYANMKHRHISAGGVATCGVLMDRTGYCVGDADQGMLPAMYASTRFAMLEAGGSFSYGLTKSSKELITFGPGAAAIPTVPPSGFRKSKTRSIAAGAGHVCAIGQRSRKATKSGLPKKGAWCGGTDGEEVTGISDQA